MLFANRALAVETLEERLEQTYAIPSDASISVRNTDGSIRIYGSSKPELIVRTLKRAYKQERLSAISVDVKIDGSSVMIDTKYPPPPGKWSFADRSGTVDYIILVPQTATVSSAELTNGEILLSNLRGGSAKARLVNGWMWAQDCFTDLDLAITNGRFDLTYGWWEAKAFNVKVTSDSARVRVALPPDAVVDLIATSISGNVRNAFAKQNDEAADQIRSIVTSIGRGLGAKFNIKNGAGNVAIERAY